MIALALQLWLLSIATALGSYGTYVPGDAKDEVLFFHLTEDRFLAVAETNAAKTVVRSDTRLARVSEGANLVRAARGSDGIYVVVGAHLASSDDSVTLLRVVGHGLAAPPIVIGHGTEPDVVARPDSKLVVASFFEERTPNEPMLGSKLGPPAHVLHVQVRDAGSLGLAGARTFRGRDERLLDAGDVTRPLAVPKCTRMEAGDRVSIDLPARGHRRRIVARLPLLSIADDRDGPAFDADDPSVVRVDAEESLSDRSRSRVR